MAKVINHQGKLAVLIAGWQPRWDEPVEDQMIEISNIPAEEFSCLEGKHVEFLDNNLGVAYYDGRPFRFNFDDKRTWHIIRPTRQVKKPRAGHKNGQRYDWIWNKGRWERR